jgi:hypothetical protein
LADIGGYASNNARIRSASASGGMNGTTAKKRKMSHGEEQMVPDLGEMGMEGFGQLQNDSVFSFDGQHGNDAGEEFLRNLDQDVDELLRQEGGGDGA